MTTPVSSANSSFYDPNAQFSPVAGNDPNGATSGPPPVAPLSREITVPPVVITGDAGARQLLRQHDAARQARDCSQEGKNAALSCAKAGIAAAGGGLLASTVVAAGVAAAGTFAEALSCGKDLRAYYDCKTE
jgi:hypothetical protein